MSLTAQNKEFIPSGVFHWSELPVKKSAEREGRRFMEGSSTHLDYLEMHATTQIKGAMPSPPHTQTDIEEIIIVKEGTMKFFMNNDTAVLGAGSVILIPPLSSQALQNVGDGPLTYYVIMYRSNKPLNTQRGLTDPRVFYDRAGLQRTETSKGSTIKYFDKATASCERLEMHISNLKEKGPSHAQHTHIDTEVILVTEGKVAVEIKGIRYEGVAGDLFLINSNEVHGVENNSDQPCEYFAFKWK
ncbi:MAG: cupin domain-containing protein [Saprospiraceae bacterium]